jgi:hypothetical protein
MFLELESANTETTDIKKRKKMATTNLKVLILHCI